MLTRRHLLKVLGLSDVLATAPPLGRALSKLKLAAMSARKGIENAAQIPLPRGHRGCGSSGT